MEHAALPRAPSPKRASASRDDGFDELDTLMQVFRKARCCGVFSATAAAIASTVQHCQPPPPARPGMPEAPPPSYSGARAVAHALGVPASEIDRLIGRAEARVASDPRDAVRSFCSASRRRPPPLVDLNGLSDLSDGGGMHGAALSALCAECAAFVEGAVAAVVVRRVDGSTVLAPPDAPPDARAACVAWDGGAGQYTPFAGPVAPLRDVRQLLAAGEGLTVAAARGMTAPALRAALNRVAAPPMPAACPKPDLVSALGSVLDA